jgi:hypothetical protein
MTDILAQASEWLEGKRHALRSTSINYVRGGASVAVLATIGKTVFEQRDSYGMIEKTESRDYLIRTVDLVLSGLATLPERGDRIRETVGDVVFVYEVMAPGDEPHYRYSDLYRKTVRVHTKHVDTEE